MNSKWSRKPMCFTMDIQKKKKASQVGIAYIFSDDLTSSHTVLKANPS